MTTSVVMCTYNGENYIEEQLNTIFLQSRQPDEVLISDDRSSDRTVSIIRKFIQKHSLEERWHLYENPVNLGWKKNFMETILRSSGDVIFLADQDDIWHQDKIKIMAGIHERHPDIRLLVCDCFPFDSGTGKKAKHFLPKLKEHYHDRVTIQRSFAECLRPGCTYALSSSMKEYIDELWQEDWSHDQFFWCLALAQGGLYHCHKELVKWRRSEENNSPLNDKSRDCRKDLINQQYCITKCIVDYFRELHVDKEQLTELEKAMRIYQQREKAIENRNFIKLILLIRYIRYYPKNSSWLGDLISAMR